MVFVVTSFNDQLEIGQTAEGEIAQWFKSKEFTVLPIYEKVIDTGKGPQLFLPDTALIAPDMLIFKGEKTFWIEAKYKTAFSWHRITQKWVTGIDIKHYNDYLKVDNSTAWPVWIVFLHDGGQAKDSPLDSPRGLFGNSLSYLRINENHRHNNWGKSGMVYWAINKLKLLNRLST